MMQMRRNKFMGNLRLRRLCDVTLFSPWRSDASFINSFVLFLFLFWFRLGEMRMKLFIDGRHDVH